jgi:hypothetical protein
MWVRRRKVLSSTVPSILNGAGSSGHLALEVVHEGERDTGTGKAADDKTRNPGAAPVGPVSEHHEKHGPRIHEAQGNDHGLSAFRRVLLPACRKQIHMATSEDGHDEELADSAAENHCGNDAENLDAPDQKTDGSNDKGKQRLQHEGGRSGFVVDGPLAFVFPKGVLAIKQEIDETVQAGRGRCGCVHVKHHIRQ